jgi:hypothetical protein
MPLDGYDCMSTGRSEKVRLRCSDLTAACICTRSVFTVIEYGIHMKPLAMEGIGSRKLNQNYEVRSNLR